MSRLRLDLDAERNAALQQSDEQAREAFRRPVIRFPQITPPRMYAARCGKRPMFLSLADAVAYDNGYQDPRGKHAEGTPAAQGAQDAQMDEVARADREHFYKAQRAAERAGR